MGCFRVPTLLRIRGFRFYVYAEESTEPAHVHIDKGSGTMKVWLRDNAIAHIEGLKPAEIRAALVFVREHHKLLVDGWNEFQSRKN